MRFTSIVLMSSLCAVASAHFQLQFPTPRGVFVEKNEVNFCDSYTTAVDNRTEFPLSGGSISLNSEHPVWTVGVLLSTSQNPTSFSNFSQAVPFFQVTGEGAFCFPVDFVASGISGLTDGANVTIQLEFDGGDGNLFQCADLTLRSSVSLPSFSCINATGDTVQTLSASGTNAPAPSGTGTPSSSGSAAPSQSSSAAFAQSVVGVTGFMGVLGALFAAL